MSRWAGWAKRAAKTAAAGAMHYSGLRGVLARAGRVSAGGRRVLVVSYHRVVDDFEREAERAIPGLLISRETFGNHIDELRRSGYDVVSMGDALDVIAGRSTPPRDVAVLTFDDGYRDTFEHAFPVLKAKGAPATVFLATGFVGTDRRFVHDRLFHLSVLGLKRKALALGGNAPADREIAYAAAAAVDQLIGDKSNGELESLIARMEASRLATGMERDTLLPAAGAALTWEMVREMSFAGLEFGAHPVEHVVLTHESDERIDREVALSRQVVEEHTGKPVQDFAYCNGYYDRRVVGALIRHGFRSAVTTEDSPNRVGGDVFRIKRKTLWENFSLGTFGYSPALLGCHFDDIFSFLGIARPVIGERLAPPRNVAQPAAAQGAMG